MFGASITRHVRAAARRFAGARDGNIAIIFAIALLVFGPRKLPELGKGLGEGIRALKEGMKDTPGAPTEQSKNADSKETKS